MIRFLRNIKYKILEIGKLARFSGDSFFILVLKNISSIFSPKKKYLCGDNTSVNGNGTIQVDEALDIGITGLHNIFKGDKTILNCDGKLIIKGHASIGKGSRIFIAEEGELIIGTNSFVTGRMILTVYHKVEIGNDCAISWNITIIDHDYHQIKPDSEEHTNSDKSIVIGSRVWIGCNVTILKGVKIAEGSVIAANSVVTSSFDESNVLIAGNPARVIRRNIKWQR